MKQIHLPHSLVTLVDDDDWKNLIKFPWHFSTSGVRHKHIYMHRMIMNPSSDVQIDHIDCNPLNNQKSNLRCVTNTQNQHNKKIQCNNTSGFKGVSWYANKWVARIRINGVKTHLGRFDKIEDAAAAYEKAAIQYFGEFARIN